MEMYKQLMAYYDSNELSVLQSEWNQLDSHKYDECNILAEDLISSWDNLYPKLDNQKIFVELDNLELNNIKAPVITELFFYN